MFKLRKGLDNHHSQYWMRDVIDKDDKFCHIVSFDSYINECMFFKVYTYNSLTDICLTFEI